MILIDDMVLLVLQITDQDAMINDLQKVVRSSQTEVEMLKEKCEKYVSVKNCVMDEYFSGGQHIWQYNGGKYNTLIMHLRSLKFHVKWRNILNLSTIGWVGVLHLVLHCACTETCGLYFFKWWCHSVIISLSSLHFGGEEERQEGWCKGSGIDIIRVAWRFLKCVICQDNWLLYVISSAWHWALVIVEM